MFEEAEGTSVGSQPVLTAQPVTTTQTTSPSDAGIPNQLASLVPSFNPSETDLDQYCQKVEMLTEIWPNTKLNELATRLILNTTGAAFQKLQLQRKEILTGSVKGLHRLVEILGGHWGKVNLERKYEAAERALFRRSQKADESNDSFLARADILWTDLISQGLTLEEIRAYVVLRGSSLTPDDRKRVVIESDSSGSGKLGMEEVSKSVRMLGSSFFQDLTGQKRTKGKVYDAYALQVDETEVEAEPVHRVEENGWDDDWLEVLAADGDEDAALVCDYEGAVQDVVQEDGELASAYNAYAEAGKRLSDRFKSRGFWPTSSGHKGKGKSNYKGKGKGSYKGNRKSLQQRIMESHCRSCGKKGHWRAECPERLRQGSSQPAAAPTMTTVATPPGEFELLPLEFMELPEIANTAIDETSPQLVEITNTEAVFMLMTVNEHVNGTGFQGNPNVTVTEAQPRNDSRPFEPLSRNQIPQAQRLTNAETRPDQSSDLINFASHGTFGILDSGATKSVVGSALLSRLISGLHPSVRERTRRYQCKITFRFGNQGTLDSQQAIVIPIGRLGLKIAIVPGHTPLLLSNTLMRTLQSQIDTANHKLHSPFLKQPINLHLNPKGLFLADINDLTMSSMQTDVAAETFVNETSDQPSDPTVFESKVSQPGDHVHSFNVDKSPTLEQVEPQPCHDVVSEPAAEAVHAHSVCRSNVSQPSSDDPNPCNLDHEPCRSPESFALQCGDQWPGRIPPAVSGRHEPNTSELREGTSGKVLSGSMGQRTGMAEMVPSHVRVLHEGRTPEAGDLCSSQDRTSGIGTGRAHRADACLAQDQSKTQEDVPGRDPTSLTIGAAPKSPEFGRGGSLESWGAIPTSTDAEVIGALQSRMLHMENAVTEILTHLRGK